jgi:hypothetical protein
MKALIPIMLISMMFQAEICPARQEALPTLKPKPYVIGIAPSHITATPDPLFAPDAPWQEVRDAIGFYKYYALQLDPPDWATPLSAAPFVEFMKNHKIKIGAEFGHFGFHRGKDQGIQAARYAIDRLKPIFDAGGALASLHLDGPVRRMVKGHSGNPDALTLDDIAAELAKFFKLVHESYPDVAVGFITNFPNWDYSEAYKGFNGHYTDRSGVTYLQAMNKVHDALEEAGERIAFIEIDCPYNYYTRKRTRSDDAPLDNKGKFLALQSWCGERGIKLHLIINCEPGPLDADATEDLKREAGRRFHEGTLNYVKALRRDGVFPDAFLIQSWYKAPVKHLPETEAYTFMNTARDAIRLIKKLYVRE